MVAQVTLLERLIGWLSPATAARRARARAVRAAYDRARGWYEGASRSHRTEGWRSPYTGPNAEAGPALPLLRARARDLVRNNAYAARAVAVIAQNVVGAGIVPSVSGGTDRRRARVKNRLLRWADSLACDADGRHNLYGLQLAAVRAMVESGECLIWRQRPVGAGIRGMDVALRLRLLEADHLDSLRDGPLDGGGRIVQGIETNARGERVAYWLHPLHPGESQAWNTLRTDSIRVPAEDVIHLYRQDRPGQARGVTWLADVMVRLRDLGEFADAQLVRQKVAACFAVFETVPEDTAELGADTGETGSVRTERSETVSPGMWEQLAPGHDIKVASPPPLEGFRDFTSGCLHEIAAGLNIPYEALTGELSEVNFASGRMGYLEFWAAVDTWRWGLLVPTALDRIAAWALEALSLTSEAVDDLAISWTAPARQMISPKDEVTPVVQAIGARLMSLSEAIRRQGYDPETVFAEIAAEQEQMRELGILPAPQPGAAVTAIPRKESGRAA